MNCDTAREHIFTDMADNEISQTRLAEVQAHLKICPECQNIKKELDEGVITPLRGAGLKQPGLNVWLNIEQSISAEQNAGFFKKILDAFVDLKRYKKSLLSGAFGAATAVLLFIVFNFFAAPEYNQNIPFAEDFIAENIEFVSALNYSDYNTYEADDSGFGTTLEEVMSL